MSILEAVKERHAGARECCMDAKGKEALDKAEEVVFFAQTSDCYGAIAYGAIAISVLKLRGGKFFTINEDEDYTGHGCQCGTSCNGPYDTLDEAFRLGLDDGSRRMLGVQEIIERA